MNKYDWIQEAIDKYDLAIYQGNMPAHNKNVLRSMLEKEFDFWEKQAVRHDSNTGRDDQ